MPIALPSTTTRLFAKSQSKETVLKCTELFGITTLSTNQEGTIERHHPGREGKETLSKTKIFAETLSQRSTLELVSNDTFGGFVQSGELGSVDLGDDVSLSLRGSRRRSGRREKEESSVSHERSRTRERN